MSAHGSATPSSAGTDVRSSLLVGVIGGGQLGRMMALAGIPLGLRFRFLEPGDDPPAAAAGEVVKGGYDDPEAIARFVKGLDVVTFEFENVPVEAAKRISEAVPVFPPPAALRVSQDRLVEKETFAGLGIETAPWRQIDSRDDLDRALEALGTPAVLKTRRMGYDGKGQALIRDRSSADTAWERLGGRPLILEGFVDFNRELSCLAVRDRAGQVRTYPVSENLHRDAILRESRAPAPGLLPEKERTAGEMVGRLLDHLTQDAGATSQFENHVRAVLGLPLGEVRSGGWAGMVNLIGGIPPRAHALMPEGARLHLYDKSPRPGRKLGHINVRGDSLAELQRRMEPLTELARVHGAD